MSKLLSIGAGICGAIAMFAAVSWSMDAAVNGVIKDCMSLGGFRHEDKVYVCTRVKADLVQPSTGGVELKVAEPRQGSEAAKQPGEGEGS